MNSLEHRVGRIATADLGALAVFRGHVGWALCPDDADQWWLRVPATDEDHFRKLPLLGRWSPDDAGLLVRDGRRVPEAPLPRDGWQSLVALLPLSPPQRNVPGMPPPAVGFGLERDVAEHAAAALLGSFADFAAWADTAITPRLAGLKFACAADGRVFIAGHPLPPIPGAAFHRQGRLWLPCGWRLPDHAWPDLLEEVLKLGRNRLALFHPDGSHEELDEENLVPATRAAVRTTASMNRERSEA